MDLLGGKNGKGAEEARKEALVLGFWIRIVLQGIEAESGGFAGGFCTFLVERLGKDEEDEEEVDKGADGGDVEDGGDGGLAVVDASRGGGGKAGEAEWMADEEGAESRTDGETKVEDAGETAEYLSSGAVGSAV